MTPPSKPESAKLKPCPFCGGSPTYCEFIAEVAILCSNCPAKMNEHIDFAREIIKAWNLRPKRGPSK